MAELGSRDVFSWLKTLPVAPEYHPTLAEFQDPIAYIFKIEPEASKFGICKIVPPVSNSPKKAVIYNFNRSLAAKNPNSPPTFSTRQQQIGFCPRKHQPVQRPVWQSGEKYTLPQFEAKAKGFEKGVVNQGLKRPLTALEVETLYWKASVDKPMTVEYANDMPGSAFGPVKSGGKETGEEKAAVGDTSWNMRGVSRAKGSLLRFMKEEIPGVTSPMVYVAMMFSWFAWHVEDHDLHSLNYLHMGAGKTWYGVPREAAVAFEEVIRVLGYGGEINPLVTFTTLGEKTTVMSPEVLINAGVPCCRLVQNAGEFVVTFPRAYHSGFSHGYNIGEAANIATPEWLRVAKEAAIRRASINCPPMVSHFQLLYDLALSLCSRIPKSIPNEPRSSRLRDKKKGEGETLIKESFVKDVMSNNDLLHILGDGLPVVLLPQSSLDDSTYSNSRVSSRLRGRLSVGLCSPVKEIKSSKSLAYGRFMDKKNGLKTFIGPNPAKGKFPSEYDGNKVSLLTGTGKGCSLASQASNSESETEITTQGDKSPDQGLFSCVTCGILNFACVAIVQPIEAASNHLMLATDGNFLNRQDVGPGVVSNLSEQNLQVGDWGRSDHDGLFDIPVQSDDLIQPACSKSRVVLGSGVDKGPSSLGLLALAYGNSSESDEEEGEGDGPIYDRKTKSSSEANSYQNIHIQAFDSNLNNGTQIFDYKRTHRSFDCPSDLEADDVTFTESNVIASFGKNTMPFVPRTDDDSSRLHVFCLQHAAEVVQQLRPIGGAHVLLLCHPDYPELEAEAKTVAEEMGISYCWNDIGFREATEEDKNQIRSALQSEEGLHGNADWTVKLGINLFYTVNLSRSPLYSKQMAYNSIIYKAFGRSSQDYNTVQTTAQWKGPLRQKKIVMAGKWCGKVWMSNQVHPLLAVRETDDEEEGEVHAQEKSEVKCETEVHAGKKPEVKRERVLENPKLAQSTSTIRKSERKRKSTFKVRKIVEAKSLKVEDPANASDDSNDEIIPQLRRTLRNKKPKQETPDPVKTLNWNKRKLVIDDDMEGGPSARLGRRIIKPRKDLVEAKPVETKPILKKHKPKETKKKPPAAKAAPPNPKVEDDEEDEEGEGEGEYACDIDGCPMSFRSKQELVVHKRNVCPVKGCGKKFFSHKYLLQHRRVHEDDRPLKCPWKGCSMSFKWAWARTEHIRVHTGARPYVCAEEGCGQTFRFVSDFSRHKRKTGHSAKKSTGR